MGKRKCKRIIKVSLENKKKLEEIFQCSDRMVMKALCFESQTLLARKIQHTAREEMGGWIEAAIPEERYSMTRRKAVSVSCASISAMVP